uniref:Uncharacterized protein n=1 Tax=Arundo donax TaxID=35708 RepID=A0A0A9HG02_ARUDO
MCRFTNHKHDQSCFFFV